MQDVLGDATEQDVGAAWRLAFAVTGDRRRADAAVEAAVAAQVSWLGPPSPVELLGATFREVDGPEPAGRRTASGDALIDAWWKLPADERAALWLSVGDERSGEIAASILSLAPLAVATLAGAARDHLVPAVTSDTCPTSAQLDDLDADGLGADEDAALRRHVRSCPTCPDRLDAARRIRAIGDPATGPVPVATGAGTAAFATCLGRTPARPTPVVAPATPVTEPAPPAAAAAPVAPCGPPTAAPAPARLGGPEPAPASRPAGAVAAAALAAFSSALGGTEGSSGGSVNTGATAAAPTTVHAPGPAAVSEPAPAGGPVSGPVAAPGPADAATPGAATRPRPGERLRRLISRPPATSDDAPTTGASPAADASGPADVGAPAEEGAAPGGTASAGHTEDADPLGAGVGAESAGAGAEDPEAGSAEIEDAETIDWTAADFWTPPSPADVAGRDDGEEVYGPDHPVVAGPVPAARRRGGVRAAVTSRVLAGASAGVLAAGLVSVFLVHPRSLPPFQTVRVQSPTATTLFPSGVTGPSATDAAPVPTPSIILPGPAVSTTLPATTTSTNYYSFSTVPPTTASAVGRSATPGRSSSSATTPPRAETPTPTTHPSSSTTSTTTPRASSTTSTTAGPTTTTAPASNTTCSNPLGLGC